MHFPVLFLVCLGSLLLFLFGDAAYWWYLPLAFCWVMELRDVVANLGQVPLSLFDSARSGRALALGPAGAGEGDEALQVKASLIAPQRCCLIWIVAFLVQKALGLSSFLLNVQNELGEDGKIANGALSLRVFVRIGSPLRWGKRRR